MNNTEITILNGFQVVSVKVNGRQRKYGLNSPWGDFILPCIFDSMYLAGGEDLTFSYKGSVFQLLWGRVYPIGENYDYDFFAKGFSASVNRSRREAHFAEMNRQSKSISLWKRLRNYFYKYTNKSKARSLFNANPLDYLPAFIIKWGDKEAIFYFDAPTLFRENKNFKSRESIDTFYANLMELVGILKQYHRQLQPQK